MARALRIVRKFASVAGILTGVCVAAAPMPKGASHVGLAVLDVYALRLN